jgi:hypothetical protein
MSNVCYQGITVCGGCIATEHIYPEMPTPDINRQKVICDEGGDMGLKPRTLVLALGACTLGLLAGCSIERAQTAAAAQTQMIGLSKGEVLACMGIPQAKAVEGDVEVWSYETGNGRSDTVSNGYSNTSATAAGVAEATRAGNTTYAAGAAAGSSQTNSFGFASTRHRSCTVSVVMNNGVVSRVNYSGPTGGVLTKGEQCAYAVQNCTH